VIRRPGNTQPLVTSLLASDASRSYSAPIGAVSPSTLDRTFFALSDRTRRSILKRLAGGPATIGELAAPFGLTLNGVKKHVGILEEVNLVITTKVGRSRACQLGPAELQDVTRWIDSYRRALERRLESFGAYVEARTASDG
jgi:DNA-binding transcriptional ArsR family regulator